MPGSDQDSVSNTCLAVKGVDGGSQNWRCTDTCVSLLAHRTLKTINVEDCLGEPHTPDN